MESAIEIMRKAFSSLDEVKKKNLRDHAKAGTKIVCGKYAKEWLETNTGAG